MNNSQNFSKWLKRILFLAVSSGLIFADKIQWHHPFYASKKELTGMPYKPHVLTFNWEALILFLLFIACGAIAWSFWDEYQANKK